VAEGPEWAVVAVIVVMTVVYAVGLGRWVSERPNLVKVWGAALSLVWVVLVVLTPMGVWLAFPLFFLALNVLPPRIGIPVVAVLTAVAIGGFAWHRHAWEIGAVLGPLLGALVAVAVVLGLGVATQESERRGQLEERERFAREVHDTLAQGLGSIHLLLGAAEGHLDIRPEQARSLITQAREVASSNLAEARNLVRSQGPADLAERSLPEALERLISRVDSPTAICRVEGTPFALPGSHDVAILRIAQEAVGNAVRHAQAERIAVTLTYLPDEVTLDVVDDGNGLVQEGTGFGLSSMRTRVVELDGQLAVESTPGHGTAIAATLPMGGA
ncbi:MAG: sensor histidine kinase, partial [Nocardioides sp.]|nr:sensor histidine kinase [Nocardioides sp.]